MTRAAYRIYLESPNWQRLRLRVLKRDGHRCRICNSDHRCEVHHRRYEHVGEGGDLEAADLTTLCHRCHKLYEDQLPSPLELLEDDEDWVPSAEDWAWLEQVLADEARAAESNVLTLHREKVLAETGQEVLPLAA